ncbi:hypothetical protein CMEL01_11909 [Colletotrichum melonis]|uniref:Uncharacterized protein n=1 Tax=Colletotrichum melonis TaxID=1209925 RepID=A0AAI9UZK5_9PEZI|nr:hypothetical protein CMEL01_11909 [Colletotrichum melonis]
MSPNKVPKKAGRDWVGAAALRRRRRSRSTVTANASDIFGPGAEVVGSIQAVLGPLISNIFSVPLILPDAQATTFISFASLSERRSRPYVSTPLRTTDKGHPRTESNLEHGNER